MSWKLPVQGVALDDFVFTVVARDEARPEAGFRIGVMVDDRRWWMDFDRDGRLIIVRPQRDAA